MFFMVAIALTQAQLYLFEVIGLLDLVLLPLLIIGTNDKLHSSLKNRNPKIFNMITSLKDIQLPDWKPRIFWRQGSVQPKQQGSEENDDDDGAIELMEIRTSKPKMLERQNAMMEDDVSIEEIS